MEKKIPISNSVKIPNSVVWVIATSSIGNGKLEQNRVMLTVLVYK